MLQGYKTILIGAALSAVPALTEYVASVDWNALFGAKGGMFVGGVLMILLRMVTKTPVGGKE